MSNYEIEPLLDLFIFETLQQSEQLEKIIINNEMSGSYTQEAIDEIFRIMHTIKGSSALMQYHEISSLAHAVEDIFHILRKDTSIITDYAGLSDMVLESVDFIKTELHKIRNGYPPDGQAAALANKIKNFISPEDEACRQADIREHSYKAVVYFSPGCEMENIRAYTIIHNLKNIAGEISYIPEDILDEESKLTIRNEGFQIWFRTGSSYEQMNDFFSQTIFLSDLELVELNYGQEPPAYEMQKEGIPESFETKTRELSEQSAFHQSIISVNVAKLDKLMDLVGELVTSETMLTRNEELKHLTLDNFNKAAAQHRKIINELQDVAMSIRMVTLSATLQKMNRIVRDMSRKLSKKVSLEIIGEETEVDKNIIEHISDPLMHMIRNAIDHGIETAEE